MRMDWLYHSCNWYHKSKSRGSYKHDVIKHAQFSIYSFVFYQPNYYNIENKVWKIAKSSLQQITFVFYKMNSNPNNFFNKDENCQHELSSTNTISVLLSRLEVWFSHFSLQLQYLWENRYNLKKPTTTKIYVWRSFDFSLWNYVVVFLPVVLVNIFSYLLIQQLNY